MHKEIRYEPELRERGGFGCYLDGELVAVARTYADGDLTLDTLIHELSLMRHGTPEAAPAHQPAAD